MYLILFLRSGARAVGHTIGSTSNSPVPVVSPGLLCITGNTHRTCVGVLEALFPLLPLIRASRHQEHEADTFHTLPTSHLFRWEQINP